MGCVSSFGLPISSSSSVKSSIFITSTSCVGLIEPLLTEPLLLVLVLCIDLWALRLGSCRNPRLISLAVPEPSSKPFSKSENKICSCLWKHNLARGGELKKNTAWSIFSHYEARDNQNRKISQLIKAAILTVGVRRDVVQFQRLSHVANRWYSAVHIQRITTLKLV